MPELIEVEYYRRAIDKVVGQDVVDVTVDPPAYLRPSGSDPDELASLRSTTLTRTSRRGKLLVLHFSEGSHEVHTLGLRFGMTGRLLIDGQGPIERLEYSSGKNDPAWDRAVIALSEARVSIRDPRRLGSLELDATFAGLGPEASTLQRGELANAVRGRTKAIKAVLLDQALIAGLGNLLADEALWRAGIAPGRSARELTTDEHEALVTEVRATVDELTTRGGSHMGDSFPLRSADEACTRCGGAMVHTTIGGRSTWSCRRHQR